MTVFDVKCDKCGNVQESRQKYKDPPPDCSECGSSFTRVILSGFKNFKAGDPYDLLNKPIPDPKPIKSYATDRRRGGKDTT